MAQYEIMKKDDIQSRIYTIRGVQVMLDSDLVLTCIINSYMICFGVGGKNYAQRISHSTVF